MYKTDLKQTNRKSYIVENSRIVSPEKIIAGKSVVVENNIIKDIEESATRHYPYETIDAENNYLIPGFIETHIHGCGLFPVESEDKNGLEKVVNALVAKGVNCFYATILCNERSIDLISREMLQKPWLKNFVHGIYIEGPFVSYNKRGGILPQFIESVDSAYLEDLLKLGQGFIRMMTIAPELSGIEKITDLLIANNIIPAFGHTSCTYHQAETLFNKLTPYTKVNITHLFNAMSGIHHRNAGLAMLPFINKNVFFELNTDGIHISADVIQMCYENLNLNNFVMITDAVTGAGEPYGLYTYNGKEVISDKTGIRYTDNNVMCGSNCLLPDNIKRFMQFAGASMVEAVKYATLTPAKLMGVDNKRGSIEIGKTADMIIVDEDFNLIRNLYVDGIISDENS